ncbi:MAG TPA: hypothetical protein VFP91_23260 [Vicinamibacterales bacterium]|nr:hypothetical protein [Vicinamibacterales bacterium]
MRFGGQVAATVDIVRARVGLPAEAHAQVRKRERRLEAPPEFEPENPESWKPSRERVVAVRKDKAAERLKTARQKCEKTYHRLAQVEYPFPLPEGRFAYLRLPADLKAVDVKRLTGFLNTLADDTVDAAK